MPESILRVIRDRGLSIDSESIPSEALRLRLQDIYVTRAEKVLCVEADPSLSFQDAASTIDAAADSVEHLEVVLISPVAANEPCWYLKSARHVPPLPEH